MAAWEEERDSRRTGLAGRMAIGALAGLVGTLAVTTAMRRIGRNAGAESHDRAKNAPAAAAEKRPSATELLYGAATGAVLGAANIALGPVAGGTAGMGVWLASYMGWLPGVGVGRTGHLHRARRNLMAGASHVAWGVVTSRAMREIGAAGALLTKSGSGDDAEANRLNRRA